jgi:TPR repeat protein
MKAFIASTIAASLAIASCSSTENDNALRAKASMGDANAQFELGVMFQYGRGVPENDAEAVRWYRLAADQGDARAQNYLGRMYDNGEGIAENDIEALKWYRLSAAQGYPSAQLNLGLMYNLGQGVPKDDVQAYAWWNLAAAQGNENAKRMKTIYQPLLTPEQIADAQWLSTELAPR